MHHGRICQEARIGSPSGASITIWQLHRDLKAGLPKPSTLWCPCGVQLTPVGAGREESATSIHFRLYFPKSNGDHTCHLRKEPKSTSGDPTGTGLRSEAVIPKLYVEPSDGLKRPSSPVARSRGPMTNRGQGGLASLAEAHNYLLSEIRRQTPAGEPRELSRKRFRRQLAGYPLGLLGERITYESAFRTCSFPHPPARPYPLIYYGRGDLAVVGWNYVITCARQVEVNGRKLPALVIVPAALIDTLDPKAARDLREAFTRGDRNVHWYALGILERRATSFELIVERACRLCLLDT
jgi:hypothetical protein